MQCTSDGGSSHILAEIRRWVHGHEEEYSKGGNNEKAFKRSGRIVHAVDGGRM